MNKIWLQEERKKQLEKKQEEELRRKLEEKQQEEKEEDDAYNKGIYSLVIKLDRDSSVEIVTLDSIESPQGYFYTVSATLSIHW